MKHAMRFEGGFERNFPSLRPGSGEYVAESGRPRDIPDWPEGTDGLRVGIMEEKGKRFRAVRVGYEGEEIVLRNPVLLEPSRHLGGKRFSPHPIELGDTAAGALLGDILDANREQSAELRAMRDKIRRARSGRASSTSETEADAR